MTKQGYKQTEVGLIPEDWDAKRIGDIALIERGKFTPRPRNNPIYYGGEIPFVQTGDVTRCSGKISHYSQTLNKIGLGVSKLFPKGSVLMTIAANIGYTGVLQIDMACPDSLIGINGKQVENEFLNFYFQFRRNEIEELSTSGAQKNLNIELFRPFLIPLPPTLTEQKAIATALSDVDALITSLEQTITKKKAIKQGAMQQLLTPPNKGGKRLPGFEGEWVEKTLGEVCDITGAGIDKKIVEGEKPVRLFNYMDVMKRDYVYNHELNHQVTAPYSKTNSCNVIEGDIFLTPSSELRTDIGVSAIAMEDMNGVVYSYHVYRLRYTIEINKFYGLYLLKTKQFLDQAEKMCEGSGKRYVVSMGKFRNMTVYLPKDIKEQEAISDILYDMDAEITQLETKKEKYQAIKQGMMQELLTGKTRLV